MRTPRKWVSSSLLGVALVAAAGVGLWQVTAVQAEDGVVVNGQDAANLDDYRGGMSSSNPRVAPFLAAHPDQFVVVCVAGCSGKPKIVQLLPRPLTGRTAEYLPSAAGPDEAAKGANGRVAADDDVVCLAGCAGGKPGQVVQRVLDLPPPVVAKPPQEKTSEAAPPAKPDKGPEPLDINP